MEITKSKLKQIIHEELSKIVEGRKPTEALQEKEVLAEDESMIVDMIAQAAELSPEEARQFIKGLGVLGYEALCVVLASLGIAGLEKVIYGRSVLDDDLIDREDETRR